VSDLDHVTRSRLRLWLKGERAFGLSRVAVPRELLISSVTEVSSAPPASAPQPPRPSVQPRFTQEQAMPRRAAKPPAAPPAASEPPAAAAPRLIPPPSAEPFTAPILPREQKVVRLQQLDANEVKGCTRCRLHATRTNTVFGEGDADAQIFFIGEGPGENEDLSGRPFVGKAGQLLDKMIGGMGLRRDQVMIANIVKCRPPGNRVPAPDEVATCTPYLVRQLEIVRPKVIVTLGRPAASYMLDTKLPMGKLRGQWQSWRGIKLMPTFHPSYVLRTYTDEVRKAVWSDLKKVLVELGLPVPGAKASGG
jgi:DNA polymerase